MLYIVSEVDDSEALTLAAEFLRRTYELAVEIKRLSLENVERFYSPVRRQYNAAGLTSILRPRKGELILILTDRDLYVHGLNYVFGYAPADVAVVSTRRLDPRFYGLEYDRKLFLERFVKEVVHEVGHLKGLGHCPNQKCVMHFSNSIVDTDIKTPELCEGCRARVSVA